jgi:chorismate mutase
MKLKTLRERIDKIDEKILLLLKERFNAAKEIAKIKKLKGMKIYQPKREREILRKISQRAKEYQINPKEVRKIYETILKVSRSIQQKQLH